MKILFLTAALENVAGYWRTFYLGKELAALGHSVCILAVGNSIKAQNKVNEGVRICLLPSFSSNQEMNKLSDGLSIPFHLGFNVLYQITRKLDVIHVFDHLFPQNAIPLLLAKTKFAKSPPLLFVDWDDWWGRGGVLESFYKGLGSPLIHLLTFFEEKIPLYADGVTVPNETIRRRALGVGIRPEKLFFLPNGTNVAHVESSNSQNARGLINLPKTIIFYACVKSSFDSIRNRDDPLWILLEAHKTVVTTFPNAFLGFIGRGSEKCLAFARRLGVDRNVISIGWQEPGKYGLYLVASDFLVLPLGGHYRWAVDPRSTQRLYDFVASGKPIIATETAEISKMLKGLGLVVKPGNSSDMAEKIMDLIPNLDLWKKKARRGRGRVNSWKQSAEMLERYYYSLVDG